MNALGTTNAPHLLNAAAYKRTSCVFAKNASMSYRAAAVAGRVLALRPGTYTAAYKELAGQSVDSFTTAQRDALLGKFASIYTRDKGQNVFFEGRTASGSFIDLEIFKDFLRAQVEVDAFGLFTSLPKITFDQAGIDLFVGQVDATLRREEGEALGLVPGSIQVTRLKASSISAADKSARHLRSVPWTAVYETPIHRATINGSLTL
jgi:hypothetical protein